MDIKIWSDFACPWCYIGEKHLVDAIGATGLGDKIQLSFKAFELWPDSPKKYVEDSVTRLSRQYNLSKAQAEAKVEHACRAGAESGLVIRDFETRYTNTFDAHRLMKLAETKGWHVAKKLNFIIFNAYFADARELSDIETLIELGKEAGLNENDIRSMLQSGLFTNEVHADERFAMANGIHAVPFFVLTDKATISGAASQAEFENALKKAFAGGEFAERSNETCGPDGCQL